MTPAPAFDFDVRCQRGRFTIELAARCAARVTGVFGPTGSGKSTLLALIAGLLHPDAGHVACSGKILFDAKSGPRHPAERRGAGIVFQDNRLFPHLPVRENLRFGADRSRWGGADEADLVAALALEPLLDARPAELSGGERKRVAIGRALLRDPSFLLLDEPFAALDEKRRAATLRFLRDWLGERGLPALLISHDPRDMFALTDEILVLEEGRGVYQGRAAAYFGKNAD